MCNICVDYIKGSLTSKEANRNLNEMLLTDDISLTHMAEVLELIEEPTDEST